MASATLPRAAAVVALGVIGPLTSTLLTEAIGTISEPWGLSWNAAVSLWLFGIPTFLLIGALHQLLHSRWPFSKLRSPRGRSVVAGVVAVVIAALVFLSPQITVLPGYAIPIHIVVATYALLTPLANQGSGKPEHSLSSAG